MKSSGPHDLCARTAPPGHFVLLFDGLCNLCQLGARRLVALARHGAIERVDFQEPGVLERFPGISHDTCLRQMILITPDGQAIGGFEAAVRALGTRPIVGAIARVYYLPGLRWLLDRLYALVARNRYLILGKAHRCAGGTCALHLGKEQ